MVPFAHVLMTQGNQCHRGPGGGGRLSFDSWLRVWLAPRASRCLLLSDLCRDLTRHRGHGGIQKGPVSYLTKKKKKKHQVSKEIDANLPPKTHCLLQLLLKILSKQSHNGWVVRSNLEGLSQLHYNLKLGSIPPTPPQPPEDRIFV